MTHQEQRQHELARARELVGLLDPVDRYRLGLYTVLGVLSDEARARDQWCTATIVERRIYGQEEGGAKPDAMGYALFVCGTLLGHGGEEGWQAIGDRVAKDKGLPGCFMASNFTIIQQAHAELNWNGDEEEEIATEIARRHTALEAALQAAQLAQSTPLPCGTVARRGL